MDRYFFITLLFYFTAFFASRTRLDLFVRETVATRIVFEMFVHWG